MRNRPQTVCQDVNMNSITRNMIMGERIDPNDAVYIQENLNNNGRITKLYSRSNLDGWFSGNPNVHPERGERNERWPFTIVPAPNCLKSVLREYSGNLNSVNLKTIYNYNPNRAATKKRIDNEKKNRNSTSMSALRSSIRTQSRALNNERKARNERIRIRAQRTLNRDAERRVNTDPSIRTVESSRQLAQERNAANRRENAELERHAREYALPDDSRICPRCDRMIVRAGGCNHMTCRRTDGGCGHEFNWQRARRPPRFNDTNIGRRLRQKKVERNAARAQRWANISAANDQFSENKLIERNLRRIRNAEKNHENEIKDILELSTREGKIEKLKKQQNMMKKFLFRPVVNKQRVLARNNGASSSRAPPRNNGASSSRAPPRNNWINDNEAMREAMRASMYNF